MTSPSNKKRRIFGIRRVSSFLPAREVRCALALGQKAQPKTQLRAKLLQRKVTDSVSRARQLTFPVSLLH
jgi:hypothetical protein